MSNDLEKTLCYNQVFKDVLHFATDAHAGQYRKDGVTLYILHPIRCSFMASNIYGGNYKELEILELIHDVPEDCGKYYRHRVNEVLNYYASFYFDDESIRDIKFALKCITKPDKIEGINRSQRFEQYMENVFDSDLAVCGKIIDRIDNLGSDEGMPWEFLMDVYLPESYHMLDLLSGVGYDKDDDTRDLYKMLKIVCKNTEEENCCDELCGD